LAVEKLDGGFGVFLNSPSKKIKNLVALDKSSG
jgi:hypothetical protein